MKLVVASDEKTHLTDIVVHYLKEKGHELILRGALVEKNEKWAEIGKEAANVVAERKAIQGVLFCWSGTGICIAANKIKGIKAALCWDAETARLARKWDDANIICLSLRYTSEHLAKEILDAWFLTSFDEEGLNEAHKINS